MKDRNAIVVPPLHPMAVHAPSGRGAWSRVGASIRGVALSAVALLPSFTYGGTERLSREFQGVSASGLSGITTLVVLGIVFAVTSVAVIFVAAMVEQV